MKHPLIAKGYMVFGICTAVLSFVVISNLKTWNPSPYYLGVIASATAVLNTAGLFHLIRKRRDHSGWIIIPGIIGNAISLFVIIYSVAGSLFLEYIFRM